MPPARPAAALAALAALAFALPAAAQEPTPDDPGEDTLEEEILVTADRALPPRDTTLRTQRVTRDDLDARQVRNLADALSYLSGVRVETKCQSCGFTQVRLNGLGGPYTQLLLDGLPTASALASVYGLEQLPPELIQRIDVVKGGASALYGPGAVAGVIDVTTRAPDRPFARLQTTWEAPSPQADDRRVSMDGAFTHPTAPLGAHLFASWRQRQALDLNADAISDLPRLDQLAAGATLDASPLPDATLRLKLLTLQEDRRGGDQLHLPPHEAQIAEDIQTQRLQAEARWKHAPSLDLDYALAYAFAWTGRESYYGGGGDLGAYGRTRNPVHLADARANLYLHALGLHTLTLAAQLQLDHVRDTFLGYQRTIDQRVALLGLALQESWLFGDGHEAAAGLRLDHHTALDTPALSPRLALRLRPLDLLDLRTALAAGLRPPQTFDEDLHVETVGGAARLITNAPDLRPERSLSLTQQLALTLQPTPNLTLSASLTAYLTRLTDAYTLDTQDDPDTPEEEVLRVNRGATTALGAELELALQSERWAARVGWTLERAANDQPDPDFHTRALLRTPRAYGYAELVLKLQRLQAQAGLDLTGPMPVPRYGPDGEPLDLPASPWLFNLNTSLAYTFPLDACSLTPTLGARNLLDSRQRDLPTGPLRDAAYVYGPAQPRSLFVSLRADL